MVALHDASLSLTGFWCFYAERGRWYRQWRQRRIRVLHHHDTSGVLPPEEPRDAARCDCCLTGQLHSRAYHQRYRHAGRTLLARAIRHLGQQFE